MSKASFEYKPRRAGASAMYRIVRDLFETFRATAATLRDGEGLPAFVEDEFRAFLRCGFLAGGFARFRCTSCGLDRLVPFSCKGRGFCPSCGGRRMAERAAHLVDHVLPDVPVRQWVLSLPHRLRYQLAWRHDVCRAVVGIFMRAVLRSLRDGAVRDGVAGGRGGGVAIVQRFGGALNLNIHIHALVLDGVFASGAGRPRFHPVRVADVDVLEVLATVEARVSRLLAQRGLAGNDHDADVWEETPLLGGLAAASVQGLQAIGPARGRRVRRFGDALEVDPDVPHASSGPLHARGSGFDLHAAVRVPAGQRDRLESVCRYALRPPVAAERVHLTAEGGVLLELRHRWADGTTHLVFDPVEFLGRLAVLVPRPRINLIFYYGVLGARAAGRRHIVRAWAATGAPDEDHAACAAPRPSGRAYLWAELMRRAFGFDVLGCPRCGGRLRLVALIEQRAIIRRILMHLGLPSEVPEARPARPPPATDPDLDFA